jgi:hypothetical protein
MFSLNAEKGTELSLAKTARSMASIKPYVAPRWDLGVTWQHKTLSGSLPPVPDASRGSDPHCIWPTVEGRLKYGIGQRRAMFLIMCHNRAKVFHAPSWWLIEDAQQGLQTYCQDTGQRLEVLWQPAKPRPEGHYALVKNRVLRFVVKIDGVAPGMDEGIAYYRAALGALP